MTADRYAEEGFDAIVQDVIIGSELAEFVKRIASPERYLVVLSPSAVGDRVARGATDEGRIRALLPRCARRGAATARPRRSATGWTAVAQTPDETVDDILTNLDKAAV